MKAANQPMRRRQATRKRKHISHRQIALPIMLLSTAGTALAIYALPVFLIVFGGLLPSAIAYFTDPHRSRSLFLTVGCLNLTGLLIVVRPLLGLTAQSDEMNALLLDVQAWITVYGCAASGWILYWGTPMMARFGLEMAIRMRARGAMKKRDALSKEWGFDEPLF